MTNERDGGLNLSKRAKAQNADLRRQARNGPFMCSSSMASTLAGNTQLRWLRSNIDKVQPSTKNMLRVVIDAQHARALDGGMAVTTQMGYGVYDVDVILVPSQDAVNPEDSRIAFGEVEAHWYQPTAQRMNMLRALKDLERLEDEHDAFDEVGDGSAIGTNGLLSLPLAADEEASQSAGAAQRAKGQRIIRYGWADGYPNVLHQSGFSLDLNADGDTGDNGENQVYVLGDGSNTCFSLTTRWESRVNPTEAGLSQVEREWAYPLSPMRVQGASHARDTFVWSCNPKLENVAGTNLPAGIHTKVARFRGIQAVGGVIGITLPEFNTAGVGGPPVPGGANNDYDFIVTLRAKKWVDLA